MHDKNCLIPYTATLAAIPNKDSFILHLYVGSEVVRVLLDSGASDCFISPEFIHCNHITPSPLSAPISLHLFNGTLQSKSITDDVELTLSSTDGVPRVSTCFLISPLDAACDAVLGLNWLTETNPKINWATRSVTWTPIPDYKTALLQAVLTSDALDDPLLIPDDEDEVHPDPLKFVPHIFMTLQMFSLRHPHSNYPPPICSTTPLNLKMVPHLGTAQSTLSWSLSGPH